MLQKKVGVLLVNLGTPDEPNAKAVRRYLKEFLSDKRVVDLTRLIWWPVLNLVILAIRPLYPHIMAGGNSKIMNPSEKTKKSLAFAISCCEMKVELEIRTPKIPSETIRSIRVKPVCEFRCRIYFYQLQTKTASLTRKMFLTR